VNGVCEQIARRLGEYPAVSHTIGATSRCFGHGIELSNPAAPSSWAELGSPPIAAGAAPALLWTIYKFASKLISPDGTQGVDAIIVSCPPDQRKDAARRK
jgi:hypothetical protein